MFSNEKFLCGAAGKEDGGDINNSNENASQTGEVDDPDARSVFVKNVDYGADVDQLKEHFKLCGDVVRVTIRKCPRTQQPLG